MVELFLIGLTLQAERKRLLGGNCRIIVKG